MVPTVIKIANPGSAGSFYLDGSPLPLVFADAYQSYAYSSEASGMESHTLLFVPEPTRSFAYFSVSEASATGTCMDNPMRIDIKKTSLRISVATEPLP